VEPQRIVGLVSSFLSEPPPAGMPRVTVSWAQTLNSVISQERTVRTPISCGESLALTHRLRSMHDAIVVGIGTVLADDPLLSVRLVDGPQPRPIVLDSRLRTPPACRLLAREDVKPWIFHSVADGNAERGSGSAAELSCRGARLFHVAGGGSGLDLKEVLSILAKNGISSVMVEGGAGVLASFLKNGLAGQAIVTVSPSIVEGFTVFAPGMLGRNLSVEAAVWETHGRDAVLWGRIIPGSL
jgi:riboflavin-specific deaminase-like protein